MRIDERERRLYLVTGPVTVGLLRSMSSCVYSALSSDEDMGSNLPFLHPPHASSHTCLASAERRRVPSSSVDLALVRTSSCAAAAGGASVRAC